MTHIHDKVGPLIEGKRGHWFFQVELCPDVVLGGGYFHRKSYAKRNLVGKLRAIITNDEVLKHFLDLLAEARHDRIISGI